MTIGPQHPAAGWRVLLVDDSIVVRAAVRAIPSDMPEVAAIETARSASAAQGILEGWAATRPIGVVLLDVEMPSMTGIEALPHLLRVSPSSRIVVASSLSRRGAAVTLAALAAGASDYVCKPQAAAAESRLGFAADLAADLAAKVAIWGADARRARRAAGDGQPSRPPTPAMAAGNAAAGRPAAASRQPLQWAPLPAAAGARSRAALEPIEALAIGSSTGGPQALLQLFADPAEPLHLPDLRYPAHAAGLHRDAGRADQPARRRRLPRGPGWRTGHRRPYLCGSG